jgi:formylglycine-generating enzyme required for sulfatase activity
MSSHGNAASRPPRDDAVFVPLPSDDSGPDYSHGGRPSLDPLQAPVQRAEAAARRTDLRFPENDRYQQLSDPIPGGMGAVFKALDKRLRINVAIKRIRPELANNTELIQRFEREARLQVRLKHQHLVSVRDYDSDKHGPYIVMDWIEGQSLAEVIKKAGPMAWRDAAILISKVAGALQEAHDNRIIHRDVKPGNILLDKKGEPYITDFGLACAESVSVVGYVSEMKATVGTAYFMSPEQRQNPGDVTSLTDIWSLGATLYQLLTTEDMMAWDPDLIPVELRGAVTTALKRDPSNRFGTMTLFARELIECVGNHGSKPAVERSTIPSAGDDFADSLTTTQQSVARKQAQAKQLLQDHRYGEVVEILSGTPEHLRDAALFDEATANRDKVSELDKAIRQAVKDFRLDGVYVQVLELLQLQPHREDLRRLLAQLPREAPKPVRPALLVAPFDANQARSSQEAWAKHLGISVDVTNSIGMKFRVIPPGTFEMGSPKSEPERSGDEVLHKVTISQPKLLGIYPVTQGEWTKVMGSITSHFSEKVSTLRKLFGGKDKDEDASRYPVENVSWEGCGEFLDRMNASHGMKGWRYRLPTEAEWEYACRAGMVTPYWFGSELNGKQANCDGNTPYQTVKGPYLERPCAVGSYDANAFGLFDQHGQVWEWCEDWYGAYDLRDSQDPRGPSSGSSRVLRGGAWVNNASHCRSARRLYYVPSFRHYLIGFRVLCELS